MEGISKLDVQDLLESSPGIASALTKIARALIDSEFRNLKLT